MTTTDDAGDRVLAIITHILGYFTSVIGPLIVLFSAEREYTKQHARRALNWQLSYLLYGLLFVIAMVVSIPLMIIGIGFVTLLLSILALVALSIADLVFIIIAAVRASEDRLYEYPLTIRFVKDPQRRLHQVVRSEGAKTSESTAKRGTKQRAKRSSKPAESKRSNASKGGSKKAGSK